MISSFLDMVLIPRSHFIMGSIPEIDKSAYEEETPIHIVYLTDYYISRTPITNAAYAAFIEATCHSSPQGWRDNKFLPDKDEHPVVNVSWHDAYEYCQWLSQTSGRVFRLPTEAEWEKAARGTNAFLFPWGYKWETERCNTQEANLRSSSPVGSFQGDVSPYGVLDLAGNVFEWTVTLWLKETVNQVSFRYPYVHDDGREQQIDNEKVFRLVRGGSFLRPQRYARCASRVKYISTTQMVDLGFRIVEERR